MPRKGRRDANAVRGIEHFKHQKRGPGGGGQQQQQQKQQQQQHGLQCDASFDRTAPSDDTSLDTARAMDVENVPSNPDPDGSELVPLTKVIAAADLCWHDAFFFFRKAAALVLDPRGAMDDEALDSVTKAMEDLENLNVIVQDSLWRLQVGCAISLAEFVEGTVPREKITVVKTLMRELETPGALLGGKHPYASGRSIVPVDASLALDQEYSATDEDITEELVAARVEKYVNGAVNRFGILRDAAETVAKSPIGLAMPFLVSVLERVRVKSCVLKNALRHALIQ